MHRFFVPKDQVPVITGSDVHHIKDVLRMKVGDQLELLDGTGEIYKSKIVEMKKDKIICEILEHRAQNSELRTQVAIAQGLPKAKKMDFIIQKCAELGANKIIPMLTERSVAKSEKLDRWRKIAKEAAEQSGRAIIPEILPLIKFEEVLKMKNQFDLALISWELEKGKSLKSVLRNFPITQSPNSQIPIPPSPNLLILIGPEGGFSSQEIKLAKKAGFISVSLGKRILRSETAGLAVLAAIMYELE